VHHTTCRHSPTRTCAVTLHTTTRTLLSVKSWRMQANTAMTTPAAHINQSNQLWNVCTWSSRCTYTPAMSLLKEKNGVAVFFFSLDWSDDMTNLSILLSVVRIFLFFSSVAIPVSLSFFHGFFFSRRVLELLQITNSKHRQVGGKYTISCGWFVFVFISCFCVWLAFFFCYKRQISVQITSILCIS
jgi:hypothetical protein